MKFFPFPVFYFCLFYSVMSIAQQPSSGYIPYYNQQINTTGADPSDYSDHMVTHTHTSKQSGITHVYINQKHNGISIKNGVMSIHIDSRGELVALHNQFVKNIHAKIKEITPVLSAYEAILIAARHFNYDIAVQPVLISEKNNAEKEQLFTKAGFSDEDIPVKLIYQPLNDQQNIRLAWDLSIAEMNGSNWWSVRVDAETGEILDEENWTISCQFGHQDQKSHNTACLSNKRNFTRFQGQQDSKSTASIPNSYNVFPLGTESPSHGPRQLLIAPYDDLASPVGWHNISGNPGTEFTTTKGNNVEAKDDIAGDNESTIGAFANGGSNLEFDFPVNFSLPPASSLSAALTNLFYWNNIMHDVWYHYGFDEAAGNFQENNFERGGIGNDFVRADGLDGSGTNNANFSTPADGSKPRMQMFLWSAPSSNLTCTVNTPSNIAGNYTAAKANFGPGVYNVTADLVLAEPILACSALTNGPTINGKIALIDRGTCEFGLKCLNAQNAGAIAVIVCNNVAGAPINMAPGANGASVTIPCIMLSQADCNTIRVNIPGVNVTLIGTGGIQIDGDFDNGIIAHEYGHGISIRLTGGAANVSCLGNNEQMGEGWSDWFGLMLTIKQGDIGTTGRGIGTYALGQPVSGPGIRPYRYSTDMAVNPHTYDNVRTVAIPHGIGAVWCAMIWDMSWLLIDAYGFDPDFYTGSGGNNIAMSLIIEALKLQPCSPGFVDGRNAILLADDILYGGIHKCLIWKAFARRGLGFSASQGASTSRTDGVQAFDMPVNCCNQVYVTDATGPGSLQNALSCSVNGDTIRFAPFMDGKVINLNPGITINKDLFLKGTTPEKVTLSSNAISPTITIGNNTVELENLKINGSNQTNGRVLINNGNLKCNNISFFDKSIPDNIGSSIVNNGTIIFTGTNVLNNE